MTEPKNPSNWIEHKLKLGEKIEFNWLNKNLGRAEFCCCPIIRNGKIKELHIYRLQQQPKEKFILDLSGQKISIIHAGILETNGGIWELSWCKEHKTTSFRFYVPDDSNSLHFNISWGMLRIEIHKEVNYDRT